MTTSLNELLVRDLENLIKELEAYPLENQLWFITKGINNSAGALTLHIVGNLQHFIGATLGNSGYQRNREAEFGDRNIPRTELITSINNTINVVSETLSNLENSVLHTNYPIEVFGEPISTIKFLIHLHGHLNYHLGQVNYHRRLLTHS